MGAYTSARREEDKRPDSYTWRERKGGRDGGREDQSLLTSRTHAFLYLKFDYLWPLDNSDVKDREGGCLSLWLQYIRTCSFICN